MDVLDRLDSLVRNGRAFVSEARADGWVNPLTMGTLAKRMGRSRFVGERDLTDQECDDLYTYDDFAARICGEIPNDRMRQGILLVGDDHGDLATECDRLDVVGKVTEAWTWGRTFGGGAVLLGMRHEDQSMPLTDAAIVPGSLAYLMVLDKRELVPHTWVTNFADPRFGEPETYLLQASGAGGSFAHQVVHASRLVIFGGVATTRRRRTARNSWDDSVLQRCWTVLRDVGENWTSSVHILKNLSQAVYKVKDLAKMRSAGRHAELQELMEITDMRRSVFRALMLDAEHESFEQVATANVTAVPTLLDKTWQRLSAAAGMPVTKLMGMSPAGLNATGESDIAGWNATVEAAGTKHALPQLRRIVRVVALSLGSANVDVATLDVSFPSLWQLDPQEEADLRVKTSQSDATYIDKGVLLPQEVALARFGSGRFSTDTQVNLELREALHVAEEKALLETAGPGGGSASVLNGAQMKGLQDAIRAVSAGEIPRDSAVSMVAIALGVSEADADGLLGQAGRGFVPTAAP